MSNDHHERPCEAERRRLVAECGLEWHESRPTSTDQREWKSLTDEDIASADSESWVREHPESRTLVFNPNVFARAIEAKLREKNHG